MKDLKAQIERDMAAKLKAFGREDAKEDREMMAGHEAKMHGSVKHRASGGAVDGMPAKSRLDRGGGKKGKKDGKTVVNVVVAPKGDAPPAMPLPMGPMAGPPPPMPPKPPMIPPPGAGGPMPMPPGGPPMPMRAAGGRVNRADGGEVDDEKGWEEARARFPKVAPRVSAPKVSPPAAKASPPSPPSKMPRDHGVILETEAIMNGTPGMPIGTVRRGVLDVLRGSGSKKPAEDKPVDDTKRSHGGRLTAGAGSGEGRLEQAKAAAKKS